MITHEELQHLLNQFELLENLTVSKKEGSVLLINRTPAILSGAVMMHGNMYAYELEIDLNEMQSADDVLRIVGKVHQSFDKFKEAKW